MIYFLGWGGGGVYQLKRMVYNRSVDEHRRSIGLHSLARKQTLEAILLVNLKCC